MKVLLVQGWHVGATARYALELGDEIGRRRPPSMEVALEVPSAFCYDPQIKTIRNLPEMRGTRWNLSPLNGLAIAARRWVQMRLVARTARKSGSQIVHLLASAGVGPLFRWQLRRAGARLIVTVHDLPYDRPWWRLDLAIMRGGLGFVRADAVIVHDIRLRDELIDRQPSIIGRISVGPMWGFNYRQPSRSPRHTRAKYGIPDGNVLLFFGSLRPDKGLDDVLQAVAELGDMFRGHLWVVGTQPGRSQPSAQHYKATAERLGVSSRVSWHSEWIEDDEVLHVFSAVDCIVAPYRRGMLGVSSVVALARRVGVPAIVSAEQLPVGVDLAASALHPVPSNNPRALALSIRKVLSEPRRSIVRSEGQELQEMAQLALSLYEQVYLPACQEKRNEDTGNWRRRFHREPPGRSAR